MYKHRYKYRVMLVFMLYGERVEKVLFYADKFKRAHYRALHAKYKMYIVEGELASPCSVCIVTQETGEEFYVR